MAPARALGINLAWHKGSRGSQLTWIGVMFEVAQAPAVIKLTVPKKMMEEIRSSLESWESKGTISLREVQQVTGRLSWVAGILPRTRWAVSITYAVITDTKRSEEDERRKEAWFGVSQAAGAPKALVYDLLQGYRGVGAED